MIIDDLLKEKKMSRYELSKISGVPQTTIADICSGKTDLQQCKVGTLNKIAKALDETIDSLLLKHDKDFEGIEDDIDFELYKSSMCHRVKDLGELKFLLDVIENDKVRKEFDNGDKLEALYMLAMVDYLSRRNDIPLCTRYDDLRKLKFKNPIYPRGVVLQSEISNNDRLKKLALKNAIPEFLRFNIVEGDIFNVT